MKRLVIAITALSILAPATAIAQPQHGYEHQIVKKRHDDRRDFRRHDDRRQHWTRGKQLPRSYRSHVVRDYGRYHLRRPPRGHQWVRVDNDYILISIASGVIASIVAGR